MARRQIVTEALRQWGLEPLALKLRHEGENTVFVLRTPERRLIVRLSGTELQTPVTLRGEIRFIERCVEAGIHAARPILTIKGEPFARIPTIDERTGRKRERMVTVFEHVPGRRIRPLARKDEFIFNWGALLARMHNATDGFRQTRTARRPNWDEIAFQREILSDDLRRRRWFRDEWDAGQKWLGRLPKTEQGLIHADVHEGNFKVFRGEFYLFDFDDSCVCWYAYDLAVNLARFVSATDRDRFETFRVR
ncbi:MAG: phosphotransferase, partial [Pyrinomonadaceae bacterium]